ncbi:MAG: hypothetical protein HY721_31970 [Planctomycetes bacterium]|nr:hypothetical protein [Planctomycetota bacterium]
MVAIPAGGAREILRIVVAPSVIPTPGTMLAQLLAGRSGCTTLDVATHIVVAGCDVVAPVLSGPDGSVPIDTCSGNFIRGDCNQNGRTSGFLGDIVFLLSFLFEAGARPPDCRAACDANDDGAVDVSDAAYLVNWMFRQGPPPPAPYPFCGANVTPEDPPLDCLKTICP